MGQPIIWIRRFCLGDFFYFLKILHHDKTPALHIFPRRGQTRGLEHLCDLFIIHNARLITANALAQPDYLVEFHGGYFSNK
jgi:hypothetical protein